MRVCAFVVVALAAVACSKTATGPGEWTEPTLPRGDGSTIELSDVDDFTYVLTGTGGYVDAVEYRNE